MPKKKEVVKNTSVSNCNFIGVKWDGKAIEGVNSVAKALLNLTELYKAQSVHIDTMLKVGD